jgi:hypothetical protein
MGFDLMCSRGDAMFFIIRFRGTEKEKAISWNSIYFKINMEFFKDYLKTSLLSAIFG